MLRSVWVGKRDGCQGQRDERKSGRWNGWDVERYCREGWISALKMVQIRGVGTAFYLKIGGFIFDVMILSHHEFVQIQQAQGVASSYHVVR